MGQTTIAQNIEFFKENEQYMDAQSRMEIYQYTRLMAEREIKGSQKVLDVGNGGFFNYDTQLAGHVTAVDLFIPEHIKPPANAVFVNGSILELPLPDNTYDCVLLQNVFHHITGKTVAINFANMRQSMKELYRVTAPGGKCAILESTVGHWFYLFERLVYGPASWVKRSGHPITFQFTARQLLNTGLEMGFELEEFAYVPRGRWIIQFGYTWPTMLTPARPVKLVFRKKA